MKFLILLFVSVLAIECSTIPKRHVDIESLLKEMITREAQYKKENKNFLVDIVVDNLFGTCAVKCSNGASLVPRPDPEIDINGCGSYSFNINFNLFNAGEFNGCCDGHDGCYENCYQTKKQCDDRFEGCLNGVCNKWAAEENWNLIQKLACSTVVKTMVKAVESLGCTAYKNAQLRGCKCPDK